MLKDPKNSTIRLSIIVPVYNVAPYLERCILRLEHQDIPEDEFEIICVNDGSTDDSREIIINCQRYFRNIILIDQENKGVSRARNEGIRKSRGRYLLFIDADDYVKENSLAGFLETANEHNAQVMFLGLTVQKEDGTKLADLMTEERVIKIYKGIEAYFKAHGNGEYDCDRSVAILFNKDFLDQFKLSYLEGVPYLEDGEFISRVLCLAERCILPGNSFYQRTNRPGSATNSDLVYSERANKGYKLAVSNLKMFQQKQDLTIEQRQFLNQPICKFTVLIIGSIRKPYTPGRVREVKNQLFSMGLKKLSLEAVDPEFTRLGKLYNRSIYLLILYIFIVNIRKSVGLRIKMIANFFSPPYSKTIY